MMPVHSRAKDGPSVDLIKKAKHHNMFAPSLERFSFGSVFFVRTKKMNSAVRPRTDLRSSIALAIPNN